MIRRAHWLACVLAALAWATGCTTMHPNAALATTMPLDALGEKLVPLGDAEGTACQSNVLYTWTLDSDSSIATAKARALASVEKPATALIDVSIDELRYTTFFYNRRCTVVRGRALGFASER